MEKKLKVLIADNSNQFATQCQKELETQGYEVSTMENDGAKVFDAIAKQKFDVILMDVFMTNEDAVDVLEYYQTHTVEKPIIAVLSTISSEELEKQTMSLGADYFFIKKRKYDNIENAKFKNLEQKANCMKYQYQHHLLQ